MEINTLRLKLSEISFEDLNNIHMLHSSPQVDEFNTLGIPGSIEETSIVVTQFLELNESVPRINYYFKITLLDTNNFIGLIGLKIGKLNYRIAEAWYKIHHDFWNKGYATEALSELLNFGFNELKLHRIEAGCATGNIGSIRVLEKVGMLKEGQHRQILPIRGKWVDNYTYAILETDKRN